MNVEYRAPESRIERFLFLKVPLWLVLLSGLAALAGAIVFGWIVERTASGKTDAGHIGETALLLAKTPGIIRALLQNKPPVQSHERRQPEVPGLAFLDRSGPQDASGLLVTRYDSIQNRTVAELVSLTDGKVVRRYTPEIDAINALSRLPSKTLNLARDKNLQRYRITHPYLTEDGGIVFQDFSPLIAINACGKVKWSLDGIFHHSIERDADGFFWVPRALVPATRSGASANSADDAIARISPNGVQVYVKTIYAIFVENGLRHLVDGQPYSDDPFHLNDIEPVLKNGPYWRRGDLFLSLRHNSMVLLYRPSTGRIIWHRQGPWQMQHDVNVIDGSRISIFDNNVVSTSSGEKVNGANRMILLDFKTQSLSTPLESAFKRHEIRTVTEGRGLLLSNGGMIVEETNAGRLLGLAKDGSISWRYINGKADGLRWVLGWSRYLERSKFDASIGKAEQARCGTQD
jgi:Arylsulfotransferase (ASST)